MIVTVRVMRPVAAQVIASAVIAANLYHAATREVVCDGYGQPLESAPGICVSPPPGWTETGRGSGCWIEP